MTIPTITVNVQQIPLDDLEPNPWNPNVMQPAEFQRLCESIREFGFIMPTLGVRMDSGITRVLEGEHRLKAARLLGMAAVPTNVLGSEHDLSPARQRQITLFMNEVHGTHDPSKTASLLDEILRLDETAILPYGESEVDALLSLYGSGRIEADAFIASEAETPYEREDDGPLRRTNTAKEAWRTLSFTLPEEAAAVVGQALDAVRAEGGGDDDWQCLEKLAAEYLAGASNAGSDDDD